MKPFSTFTRIVAFITLITFTSTSSVASSDAQAFQTAFDRPAASKLAELKLINTESSQNVGRLLQGRQSVRTEKPILLPTPLLPAHSELRNQNVQSNAASNEIGPENLNARSELRSVTGIPLLASFALGGGAIGFLVVFIAIYSREVLIGRRLEKQMPFDSRIALLAKQGFLPSDIRTALRENKSNIRSELRDELPRWEQAVKRLPLWARFIGGYGVLSLVVGLLYGSGISRIETTALLDFIRSVSLYAALIAITDFLGRLMSSKPMEWGKLAKVYLVAGLLGGVIISFGFTLVNLMIPKTATLPQLILPTFGVGTFLALTSLAGDLFNGKQPNWMRIHKDGLTVVFLSAGLGLFLAIYQYSVWLGAAALVLTSFGFKNLLFSSNGDMPHNHRAVRWSYDVTMIATAVALALVRLDLSPAIAVVASLRIYSAMSLVRWRTFIYAAIVGKEEKNNLTQEKHFESYWITRIPGTLKNFIVQMLAPIQYRVVAEAVGTNLLALFYAWSVHKTGFMLKSPWWHRSRARLIVFPLIMPVLGVFYVMSKLTGLKTSNLPAPAETIKTTHPPDQSVKSELRSSEEKISHQLSVEPAAKQLLEAGLSTEQIRRLANAFLAGKVEITNIPEGDSLEALPWVKALRMSDEQIHAIEESLRQAGFNGISFKQPEEDFLKAAAPFLKSVMERMIELETPDLLEAVIRAGQTLLKEHRGRLTYQPFRDFYVLQVLPFITERDSHQFFKAFVPDAMKYHDSFEDLVRVILNILRSWGDSSEESQASEPRSELREDPQLPEDFDKLKNRDILNIGGKMPAMLKAEFPQIPKDTKEVRAIQTHVVPIHTLHRFALARSLAFRIVPLGSDPSQEPANDESRKRVAVDASSKHYQLEVWLKRTWEALEDVTLEEGIPIIIEREKKDSEGINRIVISWEENSLPKKVVLFEDLKKTRISRGYDREDPRPGFDINTEEFLPDYLQAGHLEIEIMGDHVKFADLGSTNGTQLEVTGVRRGTGKDKTTTSLRWDMAQNAVDDSSITVLPKLPADEPFYLRPNEMVKFPYDAPFSVAAVVNLVDVARTSFHVKDGKFFYLRKDQKEWQLLGHNIYAAMDGVPVAGQTRIKEGASIVKNAYRVEYHPETNEILVINFSASRLKIDIEDFGSISDRAELRLTAEKENQLAAFLAGKSTVRLIDLPAEFHRINSDELTQALDKLGYEERSGGRKGRHFVKRSELRMTGVETDQLERFAGSRSVIRVSDLPRSLRHRSTDELTEALGELDFELRTGGRKGTYFVRLRRSELRAAKKSGKDKFLSDKHVDLNIALASSDDVTGRMIELAEQLEVTDAQHRLLIWPSRHQQRFSLIRDYGLLPVGPDEASVKTQLLRAYRTHQVKAVHTAQDAAKMNHGFDIVFDTPLTIMGKAFPTLRVYIVEEGDAFRQLAQSRGMGLFRNPSQVAAGSDLDALKSVLVHFEIVALPLGIANQVSRQTFLEAVFGQEADSYAGLLVTEEEAARLAQERESTNKKPAASPQPQGLSTAEKEALIQELQADIDALVEENFSLPDELKGAVEMLSSLPEDGEKGPMDRWDHSTTDEPDYLQSVKHAVGEGVKELIRNLVTGSKESNKDKLRADIGPRTIATFNAKVPQVVLQEAQRVANEIIPDDIIHYLKIEPIVRAFIKAAIEFTSTGDFDLTRFHDTPEFAAAYQSAAQALNAGGDAAFIRGAIRAHITDPDRQFALLQEYVPLGRHIFNTGKLTQMADRHIRRLRKELVSQFPILEQPSLSKTFNSILGSAEVFLNKGIISMIFLRRSGKAHLIFASSGTLEKMNIQDRETRFSLHVAFTMYQLWIKAAHTVQEQYGVSTLKELEAVLANPSKPPAGKDEAQPNGDDNRSELRTKEKDHIHPSLRRALQRLQINIDQARQKRLGQTTDQPHQIRIPHTSVVVDERMGNEETPEEELTTVIQPQTLVKPVGKAKKKIKRVKPNSSAAHSELRQVEPDPQEVIKKAMQEGRIFILENIDVDFEKLFSDTPNHIAARFLSSLPNFGTIDKEKIKQQLSNSTTRERLQQDFSHLRDMVNQVGDLSIFEHRFAIILEAPGEASPFAAFESPVSIRLKGKSIYSMADTIFLGEKLLDFVASFEPMSHTFSVLLEAHHENLIGNSLALHNLETISADERLVGLVGRWSFYSGSFIVRTGGTIDMKGAAGRGVSGAVALLLNQISTSVGGTYQAISKDSSNVNPFDWETVKQSVLDIIRMKDQAALELKRVGFTLQRAGGIVITHGTDTLEETAMVLALELKNKLEIPVIITGAHAPPDVAGSDALPNLAKSVKAALYQDLLPTVYVFEGNRLIPADQVEKVRTSPRDHQSYVETSRDVAATIQDNGTIELNPGYSVRVMHSGGFPEESYGYVEELAADQSTPAKVFEDMRDRLLNVQHSLEPKRAGLVLYGNFSANSNIERIAQIIQSLSDAQIPVWVGSRDAAQKLQGTGAQRIPKELRYQKARTMLSVYLGMGWPVEKINATISQYALTSEAPWTAYETLPANNFEEGKEVLIVFPGILNQVYRDAVNRLLTFSNKKKRELYIYGLGDGNVPLVNKSFQSLLAEYLEKHYPQLYAIYQEQLGIVAQEMADGQNGYANSDQELSLIWNQARILQKVFETASAREAGAVLKNYQMSNPNYIARKIISIASAHVEGAQDAIFAELVRLLNNEFPKGLRTNMPPEWESGQDIGKFQSGLSHAIGQLNTRELALLLKRLGKYWYPVEDEMIRRNQEKIDQLKAEGSWEVSSKSQNTKRPQERTRVSVKKRIPNPDILSRLLIQEVLASAHPVLSDLARAANHGVIVNIRTKVVLGTADISLYELGNMLLGIGAQSDIIEPWETLPFVSRMSETPRAELRHLAAQDQKARESTIRTTDALEPKAKAAFERVQQMILETYPEVTMSSQAFTGYFADGHVLNTIDRTEQTAMKRGFVIESQLTEELGIASRAIVQAANGVYPIVFLVETHAEKNAILEMTADLPHEQVRIYQMTEHVEAFLVEQKVTHVDIAGLNGLDELHANVIARGLEDKNIEVSLKVVKDPAAYLSVWNLTVEMAEGWAVQLQTLKSA